MEGDGVFWEIEGEKAMGSVLSKEMKKDGGV